MDPHKIFALGLPSMLSMVLALTPAAPGRAETNTVCTITVNSSDEKEAFQRYLPKNKFNFVELVERGRQDWLESACRQNIRCDSLIISGHFAGTSFFSDQVNAVEDLPVDELERAACSSSCPGLFANLKEVYLFGCNTLNAESIKGVTADTMRSLLGAGYTRNNAERMSRALDEQHGESNRARMRRIFFNVPNIYGFSSSAPLGATARAILAKYFLAAPAGEIASERTNHRLLAQFASVSMTSTAGMRENDKFITHRNDVCQFFDDRLTAADKLQFIQKILQRPMAEVHMFFESIERFFAALQPQDLIDPLFARLFAAIKDDPKSRARYLEFARDVNPPPLRVRMMKLAHHLGWLSPAEFHGEIMRLVRDMFRAPVVGYAEVDLVCALNLDRQPNQDLDRLNIPVSTVNQVAGIAIENCLGGAGDHAPLIAAAVDRQEVTAQIAGAYFRYHPLTEANEIRALTFMITGLTHKDTQVRALNILARHRVVDRESLQELLRFFPHAKSIEVQRALAEVFIRADLSVIDKPEFTRILSRYRLKSNDGEDMIDFLARK